MKMSLKERVAPVFGAGSSGPGWGDGKATAVACARAGAHVIGVDMKPSAAEETANLIAAQGPDALPLPADVANAGDMEAVVSPVIARHGRIDSLRNDVGIAQFGGTLDLDETAWDRSMTVDITSVFLACKHVLARMIARGRGVITNISSGAGIAIAGYDMPARYASKAAVDHRMQAPALPHARQGIRVNAILTGLINTPRIHTTKGVAGHHGDTKARIAGRDAVSPAGKMGDAWAVAYAAVFPASGMAACIDRVNLPVNGGFTCEIG